MSGNTIPLDEALPTQQTTFQFSSSDQLALMDLLTRFSSSSSKFSTKAYIGGSSGGGNSYNVSFSPIWTSPPNFSIFDAGDYGVDLGGLDEVNGVGPGGGGSGENQHAVLFVIEGLVLTLVSIFGVIGTLMSIGVLVKPAVRESFSALLTGLATCDALFLLTSLTMFGLPKLWLWFAQHITSPTAPYTFGLLHIWRVGSTLLTLSVTLERYSAICRPLSKDAVKQGYLLGGSLAFAVLYNVPKFFEIEVLYLDSGETLTRATALRNNKYYRQFYVFWSKFLLIELVPYFTIIVLNTLILMKTTKASKFRRRFVSGQPSNGNAMEITPTATRSCRDNRKMSDLTTECVALNEINAVVTLNSPPDAARETKAESGNKPGAGSGGGGGGGGGGGLKSSLKRSQKKCSIPPPTVVLEAQTQQLISQSKMEQQQQQQQQYDVTNKNVLTPLFDKASFLHERLSLEPPPHCMHRTPEVGGFHSRRASDVSDRGIGPADLKGKRHSYCGHGGSASTLASTAVITPVTPLIAAITSPSSSQNARKFSINPTSTTTTGGSQRNLSQSNRLRSLSALSIRLPQPKITVTANKEKALGATLIGVSLLFISCQSLKLIPDIYEGFICGGGVAGGAGDDDDGNSYCASNEFINTLISLSNLLMCINSAANFLMYMVRGTKFRRAFIRTYTGCCRALRDTYLCV